jgi:hypothetical protein
MECVEAALCLFALDMYGSGFQPSNVFPTFTQGFALGWYMPRLQRFLKDLVG